MDKLLIVTIIVTIQVILVHSRTTEEVVVDFQPIFDEIHNEIGKTQTTSHGEGTTQKQKFNQEILEQKKVAYRTIERDFEELETHMKLIIANNNLTQNSESIKQCFSEQKKYTQYFRRESYAGTNICSKLGYKKISKIDEILSKFYDYQANLHLTVEGNKKKCLENKTPIEVQSCLIQNLYFVHKPQVKEMEKEMYDILKSNNELLDKATDNLKVCFSIISEESTNTTEPIKNAFENCVTKAVVAN